MDKESEEHLDVALLMLFSAERMFTKRKVHEAFNNGITIGYSDDPFLLIKIQEFLAEEGVKERLEKLLKTV